MDIVVVEMLSIILLVGLLAEGIWSALSVFLWGRVRRNAVMLLAFGLFNLVVGTLLIAPLESSRYAAQDNAYLGNLFFGVWMAWVAGVTLSASLAGLGYRWWVALIAGVASLVGWGYALSLAQVGVNAPAGPGRVVYEGITTSAYGGAPLVIWMGAFGALILLLLALKRQWAALGKGSLVGLVGAAIVLGIYGYGRMAITIFGVVGTETNLQKPPFVDFPETVASVLVGLAALVITRRWSAPRAQTPSTAQDLGVAA